MEALVMHRPRKYRVWIRAGITLALVSTASIAGNGQTDNVVVTASRLAQPSAELSQSVNIIARDEIEHLHAASAAEVLRQIPGTNVIQQGGRGGITSILLRGGEPNFTLVLIDGIQVNDPTNSRGGAYDLGSLEQAQVGQVETIFGAMSPVYGSDALSGVINFISRDAASGSDIRIAAGTDGYGSVNGFYGGTLANIDIGLGAYVTDDNGDVAGADYEAGGVNGKLATTFGGSGTAGLSFGYQELDTTGFPEDSGGPLLAVLRDLDTRDITEARAGADLGYDFAERWKTAIRASIYTRDEAYSSPGIATGTFDGVPPNAADTDFDRQQVSATLATELPGGMSGLIGAEWKNENGRSAGTIDFGFPVPTNFDLDRDTVSAFAEAHWTLGPVTAQGGIRWDDPDAIRSVVTGRLGVLYRLPDGLTELRANWGEGFKAPSFFALAHPIVGNPELRSETGDSIDIGIRRRFRGGDGAFEILAFRNEYDDLVDFDPDLFINVNRDTVETRGAEAAVEYAPLDQLHIRAHVTYLDTDIKGSDAVLRGRPKWRGGIVIDWSPIQDWRWVTHAYALDEFYESSVATGSRRLAGYARVDTALTWQTTEAFSVGFAVDNLFDNAYQEAVGFPAAGFRGRIGAKYRF